MSEQNEGAAVTERQREQYRQDRERRDEWDKQPFPKSREREREANERAYWRAVAEIPNPGPVEPLTELQAFHAEQTDPPPGPYPDPPLGPYPDPVIKERPSEEAVYGERQGREGARSSRTGAAREARREGREGRSARSERQGTEDRSRAARGTGFGTDPGGREYDEPNFDGYDEDVRERAEGVPSAAAPERQSADVRKPPNARSSNVSRTAAAKREADGSDKRGAERPAADHEAGREAGPEDRGHAGRPATDRPADRPGER